MNALTVEEIARALDGKKSGAGYQCKCPAHEDKKASLSLSNGERGVVFHCHAGCAQDAVVDALKSRGLWHDARKRGPQILAAYDYRGQHGEIVSQVVRYFPKDFRQRRPDGAGGWIWKMQGVARLPYRLPEVLAAIAAGEAVYIVEGEKDCDNLRALGLVGTCNAGGAGKWQASHSQWLKGANVIVLPDNDDPGRAHAKQVEKSLAGIASAVKVVALPGLPPKGDVSDWLAAGGTREQLDTLAAAAAAPAGASPKAANGAWPAPLDLAALAEREPEAPRFIVPDWGPVGYAWLLGGHGGAGKSTIALHLALCIAHGARWAGIDCAPRKVFYLSGEDRAGVLHWRLARICRHLGMSLVELVGRLEIVELVGHDAILWERDPRTGYCFTPAYGQLSERVRAFGAEVLIVDGVTDTFGGNENSRAEVKRYVNALLALVPDDTGALLLVAHVDKALARGNGATSEGYSGSTAWHNAVRARWYLYPETSEGEAGGRPERTGLLRLELQKSNHGRIDQIINWRWDEDAHMFLPEAAPTTFDRKHREREEQRGLTRALQACAVAGLTVPAAMQGSRTGYHVLSMRPEVPDSLRSGRAGVRRFWRHIEHLRHIRHVEVRGYRRANGHKGEQLCLTTEGERHIAT